MLPLSPFLLLQRLIADLKNVALEMVGLALWVAESPWGWEQQLGGSACCVTWPEESS